MASRRRAEALTMLPPRVPRFWLAMVPVQLAACARMGNSSGDDGVFADVGEGGSGADGDGVGSDFDEAELFEIPEGDEFSGLEAAGAECDHEFGAAGDGGVAVGRVGEDLQDRVERVGCDEFVLGDVGAHYFAAPARAACWTALKMRM